MKKNVFRITALMALMMMTMTTFAQSNDSISTDTTMWFNQTQELSGVVVKGRLPKTRVKGDAMRTRVAGTILEKAGTVSDALSKIPTLEAERDGGVKVLGRGDAEVYINGRRVQDMKELSRLRSDQIQHVDVVQNPGARYAASVKAVVRITLKKAQGEGLSFQNSTQYMYQYGGSLNNNFVANYRTGGLDVTGSFWVGTYNHYKGLQVNDMLYYVGPNQVTGHSTQEMRHPWHAWSPQLQLNYMVNENHTFGAYYKYDRTPSSETKGDYLTDMFENGILTERSASYIWQDQNVKKHIFNAYYNGKVGELGIDLNIDGLFDDTKTPGRTTEQTTAASVAGGLPASTESRLIESNTNSGNNFWASKLIFSYPILKGNLSVGGEYSYNHRTDAYTFQASDYVPVKATDTEINEKSAAAFVEYGQLRQARGRGVPRLRRLVPHRHRFRAHRKAATEPVVPPRHSAPGLLKPDQLDDVRQPLHLSERQPLSEADLHPQPRAECGLSMGEPDRQLRSHKEQRDHVHRAFPRQYGSAHQPRPSHQQRGGLQPALAEPLRTPNYQL